MQAMIQHLTSMARWRDRLMHLGLNKDGSPKHPLYIAASTKPKPFTLPEARNAH